MRNQFSRFRKRLTRLLSPRVIQTTEANRTENTSILQTANIFNFFLISLVLAVALTALIVLAVIVYRNSRYNHKPMTGSLNVAVVRFNDWSKGECVIDNRAGTLVANAFYRRLEQDRSVDDIYRSSNILLELRSPDELRPVRGRDHEELIRSVEDLAIEINAHIVVYGVLTCAPLTQAASYQLMFYVAPSSFGDAQELIGQFAFRADALYGEINSGKEFLELNKSLQQKIEVISILVKGIGSFWGEDYDRSLEYLSTALDSVLWERESGKESIHIIAGNCESRYGLYLLMTGHKEDALAAIERARAHYLTANELTQSDGRGDYGRSYIGLAGVEGFYALQESMLTNRYEDIDRSALDRQERMLDMAERAAYAPSATDIPEKVAFHRAQIDLLWFQLSHSEDDLSGAKENYQFVIDSYRKGNVRVREIAGHSYAGLAILERIGSNTASAIENYQQAVNITRVPGLQAQYLLQMGNTYYADNELAKALEYYREVLNRKSDLENRVPPSTIEDLEKRIAEIERALSTPVP